MDCLSRMEEPWRIMDVWRDLARRSELRRRVTLRVSLGDTGGQMVFGARVWTVG